jgi:hypothetical protein
MAKYAIIDNNVVINLIEYDSTPGAEQMVPFPDTAIAVASETAGVGNTYDGSTFTDPTPPVTLVQHD